jgi:peptidoglycan/LPS O-acetylase OafA/YrhL
MDPVSVFPAMAALVVAFFTMGFWLNVVKLTGFEAGVGRFSSIDGLRGYLALFVFIYHSCMWYFFMQTGDWQVPPSNLYTNLGEGGVAMFFMITGFLFFSKLINARENARDRGIDWMKLFVSRFMRLAPLYFFAVGIVFIAVAILSDGVLKDSPAKLLMNAGYWLGLGILPTPDLNGVNQTWMMVAGVTWSLRYEWLFYLALPACALLLRVPVPGLYKAVGLMGLIGLIGSSIWSGRIYCVMLFATGAMAAFLVRSSAFRRYATSRGASVLVGALLCLAFLSFRTIYQIFPILLLSAAFFMIAGGNSLFGIFVHPVSRALGELAYGIYLLHGLVLFFGLNFVVGVDIVRSLSPVLFWGLILLMIPLIITACIFTFRYIEKPAMDAASSVAARIRGQARMSIQPQ